MNIINLIIFIAIVSNIYEANSTPLKTENARFLVNKKKDRLHLRSKTTFTLDRSARMLVPHTDGMEVNDFTFASTPPLIKMMIVPGIEPAYLPDDAKESLFLVELESPRAHP